MSASLVFIKGPVDTNPLNMATTRPVARMTKLSKEVKPNMMGVNITPPPIPPITARVAMAVLIKKDPTMIIHMDDAVRTGVLSTFENAPMRI